jgi:hypothetical protein
MFEHRSQSLLPFPRFVARVLASLGVALAIDLVALGRGGVGFRWLERLISVTLAPFLHRVLHACHVDIPDEQHRA